MKTILSAGEVIHEVLSEDAGVQARARKIYPVVEDKAELPYIVYRRTALEQTPTKGRGADTATIAVECYTEGYTEGVELAEAVRDALDGIQAETEELTLRSCVLTDSEETWVADAYVQQLVFTVKM